MPEDKRIQEIRELCQYYTHELYTNVRREQKEDITYIDDTFEVPEVKEPHKPMRMGTGADIVDSPAEQIITSNPQVFVSAKNDEVRNRIGTLINITWIPILKRANPNPFKEFVKNCLSRGESFIKLVHNPSWVIGDSPHKSGLPVLFLIPDPMVVYASPEEDENGIPDKVIVWYERQHKDVIVNYPNWTNPKKVGLKEMPEGIKKANFVEWFEYWDRENRYFEADSEPVLKDNLQPSLYTFTPFIRKYSGFGKRSYDGELANLIMSDIRKNRDLIRNECIMNSDIASILHLFAHRPKILIHPTGTTINEEQLANIRSGAYTLNDLELPEGATYESEEQTMPTPEMFRFAAEVSNKIRQRNPFLMAGFPMGQSGRQQDMSAMSALKRYDTIVENTEHAWATAFEKALVICNRIPGLYPDGLHKGDLDGEIKCVVKLKAEDVLESDRKATLGSRLVNANQPEIDPITNLVEFKGYTRERAEEIMVDMLKWRVILNSPDIMEIIGLRAAEKSGMTEAVQYIKQRRMMLEQQQKGLVQQPSMTQTNRMQGEEKTGMGREMVDMMLASRGARKSPDRYTRGQ